MQERDAAAARARSLLDQAARDRKAASPPEDNDCKSHISSQQHHTIHDALLLHEAAAVLNLHAQGFAFQNILCLVPIVPDN